MHWLSPTAMTSSCLRGPAIYSYARLFRSIIGAKELRKVAMKSKICNLISETFDLITTVRPGSRAYKVFTGARLNGGPQTKLGQLSAGAARSGEPYGTVVCLSAARVPLIAVRLLRRLGARIVVNQNGVYYPLWCPDGFRGKNRFLRGLNRVAHHSFFQSRFSEFSFERWVGPLPVSRSVLFNAVDRSRFFPAERNPSNGELRALVFLDFRDFNAELWDYLTPLLAAPPEGYRWVLMGQKSDSALLRRLQAELANVPVEWHFSPGQAEVASVLRGCDLALHLVFNDVCPNKVIECLASGVHVICSTAGGTVELIAECGGEALHVPDGFEQRNYPARAAIIAAMKQFRENAPRLKREAVNCGKKFDLASWLQTMTGVPHA
jgi:glycosyltransferase involved in cell wall biosynthesis